MCDTFPGNLHPEMTGRDGSGCLLISADVTRLLVLFRVGCCGQGSRLLFWFWRRMGAFVLKPLEGIPPMVACFMDACRTMLVA